MVAKGFVVLAVASVTVFLSTYFPRSVLASCNVIADYSGDPDNCVNGPTCQYQCVPGQPDNLTVWERCLTNSTWSVGAGCASGYATDSRITRCTTTAEVNSYCTSLAPGQNYPCTDGSQFCCNISGVPGNALAASQINFSVNLSSAPSAFGTTANVGVNVGGGCDQAVGFPSSGAGSTYPGYFNTSLSAGQTCTVTATVTSPGFPGYSSTCAATVGVNCNSNSASATIGYTTEAGLSLGSTCTTARVLNGGNYPNSATPLSVPTTSGGNPVTAVCMKGSVGNSNPSNTANLYLSQAGGAASTSVKTSPVSQTTYYALPVSFLSTTGTNSFLTAYGGDGQFCPAINLSYASWPGCSGNANITGTVQTSSGGSLPSSVTVSACPCTDYSCTSTTTPCFFSLPTTSVYTVNVPALKSYSVSASVLSGFSVSPVTAKTDVPCGNVTGPTFVYSQAQVFFLTAGGDVTAVGSLSDQLVPAGSFISSNVGTNTDAGIISGNLLAAISGGGKYSQNTSPAGTSGWNLPSYTSSAPVGNLSYTQILSNVLSNSQVITSSNLEALCASSANVVLNKSGYDFYCYSGVTSFNSQLAAAIAASTTNSVILYPLSSGIGSQNLTSTPANVSARKILVLVNGNLTFSPGVNVTVNSTGNSALAFVLGANSLIGAIGDLTVSNTTSRLDGLYIFPGTFNSGSSTTQNLVGGGSLLGTSSSTSFSLGRNINNAFGENWTYQSKYLDLFKNILARPNVKFQEIAATNEVPVTVDITAPTVPGAPSIVSTSTTQIAISWGASTDTGGSGFKNYEVFRDGKSLGFTTGTSYTDTSVVPWGVYNSPGYQVRAWDNQGNYSALTAPGLTVTATNPTNPLGFADFPYSTLAQNCARAAGWVCDITNASASGLVVRARDGSGALLGSGFSGTSRPDVPGAGFCGSNPNVGINFNYTSSPLHGNYTVSLYAVDVPSGTEVFLPNSVTLSCP